MNGIRQIHGLAANVRRLIDETCVRFQETCGWPLGFDELVSLEGPPSENAEHLWQRPLTDGRQCLGDLILDLPDDERLDFEFLQVAKSAEMVAVLLEEAICGMTLSEVSRRENEELARIGSTAAQHFDLIKTLDQMMSGIVDMTGFRAVAFFLLDSTGQTLQCRHSHLRLKTVVIPHRTRELCENSPDRRALNGEPILFRRWLHPEAEAWLPPGMATALCLPVRSHEGPIGTLWMFDRRDRMLEPREAHVLSSIAIHMGNLLERAVLLTESASEKQLRKNLQAAGDNSPGHSLTEPGPGCGFESAGIYRSSLEIGGDLVEMIPLSSSRTLIAVGDASGHGIPAAMVMANVRGAIQTVAQLVAEGAMTIVQAVSTVNRTLCRVTPTHQFMSIVVGIYDAAQHTFEYTNAGHPNPFRFRAGEMQNCESHGLLLGVIDEAEYEGGTLTVEDGDLLIFYTDGISEAMSRSNSMFRSDGIVGAIQSLPSQASPQEIVAEIWSRLTAHQSPDDEADDRSMLVMRIH